MALLAGPSTGSPDGTLTLMVDQVWVAVEKAVRDGLDDKSVIEAPPKTEEDVVWLAATISDHVVGALDDATREALRAQAPRAFPWGASVTVLVSAVPAFLYTMYLRRDGFSWLSMILVLGSCILVGAGLQDLSSTLRQRKNDAVRMGS